MAPVRTVIGLSARRLPTLAIATAAFAAPAFAQANLFGVAGFDGFSTQYPNVFNRRIIRRN